MVDGWDELGVSSAAAEAELGDVARGGEGVGLVLRHDRDDRVDGLLEFLGAVELLLELLEEVREGDETAVVGVEVGLGLVHVRLGVDLALQSGYIKLFEDPGEPLLRRLLQLAHVFEEGRDVSQCLLHLVTSRLLVCDQRVDFLFLVVGFDLDVEVLRVEFVLDGAAKRKQLLFKLLDHVLENCQVRARAGVSSVLGRTTSSPGRHVLDFVVQISLKRVKKRESPLQSGDQFVGASSLSRRTFWSCQERCPSVLAAFSGCRKKDLRIASRFPPGRYESRAA